MNGSAGGWELLQALPQAPTGAAAVGIGGGYTRRESAFYPKTNASKYLTITQNICTFVKPTLHEIRLHVVEGYPS